MTARKIEGMPSSYQVVGDVMLLKFLKIKEASRKKQIALSILDSFPYIRTVCEIAGISGELRKPKIIKLAGNGFETIHKEHGILYKLDVSKVMFSKGNLNERKRLIGQIKRDETIIDMFAGIGYFSLGIAKNSAAKKIYAIEKNPASMKYLKENIKLNKINNIVPILGDCRKVSIEEKADRIIMGYFPGTDLYLPYALKMLKKGGIIHYHNVYMEEALWKKPEQEIRKYANNFTILNKKKVKSVAPRTWHIVLDILVN